MKIVHTKPRADVIEWCTALDFPFVIDSRGVYYWNESKYYVFEKKEMEILKKATDDLVEMSYKTCEYIIENDLLDALRIPEKFHNIVKKTFYNSPQRFLGRFDFAFIDNQVKLLEYNADTPVSHLESGKIIPKWEMDKFGTKNSYNTIEENLIDFFIMYKDEHFHFATSKTHLEDSYNTHYLVDIARKQGVKVHFIDIIDIYYDDNNIYDKNGLIIKYLYKLQPWEHIMNDDMKFTDVLIKSLDEERLEIFENIWNMMISNKAFLVFIKELFPDSPYLLNASFNEDDMTTDKYIKKPMLEREGVGIEYIENNELVSKNELDGKSIFKNNFIIYQEFTDLPKFEDKYMVIGSWVVNDKFSGILIREDENIITTENCQFIPYIVI